MSSSSSLSAWSDRVTSSTPFHYAFSFVCGAIIGVVASFTVNCTLVEITINSFFAVYFGLLFMLISGIIFYRVRTGDHPKPNLLLTFAVFIFVSGLLCLVLDSKIIHSMSAFCKIPLYTILGISVTFALLFSVIDLINYCSGLCCQPETSMPLVNSEKQVYLVVVTAVTMGFVFGFIFGWLDVEDEQITHMRVALLREESYCYPIGGLIGGIATVINQHMRENAKQTYDPVADDDLDENY